MSAGTGTAGTSASVEPAVLSLPVVYRIVADHPEEEGVVHVGDAFTSPEDVREYLAEAPDPPAASPGGPGAEERVKAHPVTEARALGYELRVERLVPDELGEDDAGNQVAVTSRWERVD